MTPEEEDDLMNAVTKEMLKSIKGIRQHVKYLWALDATAIAQFDTFEEAVSALDELADKDGMISIETDLGGPPKVMRTLLIYKGDISVMSEDAFDLL